MEGLLELGVVFVVMADVGLLNRIASRVDVSGEGGGVLERGQRRLASIGEHH